MAPWSHGAPEEAWWSLAQWKAPAGVGGDGGWGFHLRDGGDNAQLRAIPYGWARLCRNREADVWCFEFQHRKSCGVSSSELAERFGHTRLEGLRSRERDLLGQRCEFFGLLGQRLELLA
jgi:hypothetical protein